MLIARDVLISRLSYFTLISGLITGGTGKFLGIRGMMKLAATFDLTSGFNDSKGEIEYWMEK